MDSIDWPSGNPETINYKALDIHLSKYQVCNLLTWKTLIVLSWSTYSDKLSDSLVYFQFLIVLIATD